VAELPTPRAQLFLCGATLPSPVKNLMAEIVHPHRSRWVSGSIVGAGETGASPVGGITVPTTVSHTVLMVAAVEKAAKLQSLYDTQKLLPSHRVIVFVNGRATAQWLAEELESRLAHHGVRPTCLHPKQTDAAQRAGLNLFQSGASNILVTTDAYARGVDFESVSAVVHYDLPMYFEEFVHRAGRCGRRGERGASVAFFQPEDARIARPLVALLNQRGQFVPPRLRQYARESLSTLYQRQVAGLEMKRFDVRDPATHKHPLGPAQARFVSKPAGRGRNQTPVS
jgi:superfamily II DNA/RNA helicase